MTRPTQHSALGTQHLAARRGAALLLVLSIVSLAAVLGYAMLSVVSLQRQVEGNLRKGPEAESLAESGVNLAIYYLLHPETAPGYPGWANVSWYWPGTGGPVGFGAALEGTIDVVVAADPLRPFEYEITSTGVAGSGPVQRTVNTRVYVNAIYEVKHGATFGSDVIIGSGGQIGAVGDLATVLARGNVQIKLNGKVYGNVYRGSAFPASQTNPLGGGTFKPLPLVPVVVPADLSEVRSYLQYQLPSDPTVYNADVHAGGLSLGGTWGPSAGNPAGVHFVDGDLTLLANAAVQGTLIVKGNLSLNLLTTTVTVASLQPTLPALLVGNNVDYSLSAVGGTLAVTGACWVGGKVDGGALNTNTTIFNVTGALLCDGGLFPSVSAAKSLIKYRPELVQIHDFTNKGRTPKSVRVISWRDGR